jgi:hypothetical protein
MIFFIWLFNLVISIFNLYAVGSSWVETKAVGGWVRIIAWAGAVMTAIGFTYTYLMVFAFGSYYTHAFGFGEEELKLTMEIGFVVIVPGILVSGFLIWLDSWKRAFQEGGFVNYGVAVYNTWAQYHNTMAAINGWGEAVGDISKAVGNAMSESEDAKGALVIFCIALVVAAVSLGILTTVIGIKKLSASKPLPEYPREKALAR